MNTRLDEMGLEFNFQWNLVHSTVSSSFFRRSDWMDSAASASAIRYYVLYSRPYGAVQAIQFSNKMERNPIECRLAAFVRHSGVGALRSIFRLKICIGDTIVWRKLNLLFIPR